MTLQARMKKIFSRKNLPKSRWARILVGVLLVLFGLVGFLPVVGFWMIPAGLAILSIDIPVVRRFTTKASAVLKRWWVKIRGKRPKKAS